MPNITRSPNLRNLTNIAFGGIIYYIVIFITLHFLRTDVNPINQMSNEYAFGPLRFLMITAYFGMSLASLLLIIGLNRGVSQQARSQAGIFFLILWIAGLLIAGIFPLISDLNQETMLTKIYQISAPLHILSLTIGAILISWRLKYDENWHSVQRILLAFSLLLLVLFIVVGITTATESDFAGFGQRIFIAGTLTWFSLILAHLRSLAT